MSADLKFTPYIGTKQLAATPMLRGDYNNYRGWTIPEDENPNDEGYLVKYPDGYVSWSPKSTFESAYRTSGKLNFGHAIELLKSGYTVTRVAWGSKDTYLFLHKEYVSTEACFITKSLYDKFLPYICMRTANGDIISGWTAGQNDIFAEDWVVVSDAIPGHERLWAKVNNP